MSESEYLREINSVQEYCTFLENYTTNNKAELWYRGHRSQFWELKPNLYRNMEMIKNTNILNYNIIDFRESFIRLKKEILNKNLFDISNLNDFQIMFIAQHYGLLTPILDWTSAPLIALFFAIDEYNYNSEEFPVIYILEPGFCNENSCIVKKSKENFIEPICIDNMDNNDFDVWTSDLNRGMGHIPIAIFGNEDFLHRISSQSGKFTFHQAVGTKRYSWDNIDIEKKRFVEKIKINPNKVETIKALLCTLGINKKSIYRNDYPNNLDNTCNKIKKNSLVEFEKTIKKINEKSH